VAVAVVAVARVVLLVRAEILQINYLKIHQFQLPGLDFRFLAVCQVLAMPLALVVRQVLAMRQELVLLLALAKLDCQEAEQEPRAP